MKKVAPCDFVRYARFHLRAELIVFVLYALEMLSIIMRSSNPEIESVEMGDALYTTTCLYFMMLAVINGLSFAFRTMYPKPFNQLKVVNHVSRIRDTSEANGFCQELAVKPVMSRDKMLTVANKNMMWFYGVQSSFVIIVYAVLAMVNL